LAKREFGDKRLIFSIATGVIGDIVIQRRNMVIAKLMRWI
jgi:hypothetical protein